MSENWTLLKLRTLFIKRQYLEETEKTGNSVGEDILIMYLTKDTFVTYKELQTNKTKTDRTILK